MPFSDNRQLLDSHSAVSEAVQLAIPPSDSLVSCPFMFLVISRYLVTSRICFR